MTVWVFGNQDMPMDAMPLRLLPALRERFPKMIFEVRDPNEEWEVPERLIVLDTVVGIKQVSVLHDLDKVAASPRYSVHDFDAGTYLKYLKKIGKLQQLAIVGVPPDLAFDDALKQVALTLRSTRL